MSGRPGDAELKVRLTPEQYSVTRQAGARRAFTGEHRRIERGGSRLCVVCAERLFSSRAKYRSGAGWPSFRQPLAKASVEACGDDSYGMRRTELRCSNSGAHLGHVFEDGPQRTGQRYRINSAALDFRKSGDGE